MEIYGELDRREYWNVAVLDTEKASKAAPPIFENALSKEVEVREDYLRPFIDMLLGLSLIHILDQSEPVPAPGLQQSDGICGQNRELL